MSHPHQPEPQPTPSASQTPLGDTTPLNDTTTPEAWEQVRRSVAMLPPGAWAMRREQALDALGSLVGVLRNRP